MIRFGKSNKPYMEVRHTLVEQATDRARLERIMAVSRLYSSQPARTACVVCGARLGEALLQVFGVGYTLCPDCGHFNGLFEDTPAFGRAIYERDAGQQADAYVDGDAADFGRRVASIYRPKAEFLRDALSAEGVDPPSLRYADIGAGAGHFVAALRQCGLSRCIGYEPSAALSAAAGRFLGPGDVVPMDIDGAADLVATLDVEVVTMIFSLEHVPDFARFVTALRGNPSIRYFFFAVPTFSPSVFVEASFQGTVPRVLGNGHTHLFCDRSLDEMCRRFRLRRGAEWWFGGTAFDLYRQIAAALATAGQSRQALDAWRNLMEPLVDDLQLAMDRRHLSSEVHVLTVADPPSPG